MSDQRTVRPAEGRRVRKPDTGVLLAEAGEAVTWSAYWHRKLDDGDVVEGVATVTAKPKKD